MNGEWEGMPSDTAQEQVGAPEGEQPEITRSGGRWGRGLGRRLAGLTLVALFAALGVTAYQVLWRPSPSQMLARVRASYEQAASYTATGTMSLQIVIQGTETKMRVPVDMAYRKPNLLYVESGQGIQHSRTVCDGERIYMEMDLFDTVVSAPAPKNLEDLPQQLMAGMGQAAGASGPFSFSPLPCSGLDAEMIASVEEGFDRENEWLKSVDQPRGARAITVTMTGGPSVVMWIDRGSHLLRQVAAEMSGDEVSSAIPPSDQLPEGMDERLAEMVRTMMVRMVMAYERQSVNEPPPRQRFAYTPPKGKKLVEAGSVEDMYRLLFETAKPEPAKLREMSSPWGTGSAERRSAPEVNAPDRDSATSEAGPGSVPVGSGRSQAPDLEGVTSRGH